VDDATDPKYEIFDKTWEKASMQEDFFRTWPDKYDFNKAADYWTEKGGSEIALET